MIRVKNQFLRKNVPNSRTDLYLKTYQILHLYIGPYCIECSRIGYIFFHFHSYNNFTFSLLKLFITSTLAYVQIM